MTKVALSRRYPLPDGGSFDAVDLREPTYADRHMSGLGAPFDWQPNGKGGSLLIVYPSVVDAYLQRIVTAPGYEHIGAISAVDAGRLEAALIDFFRDAPIAKPSQTGLSSTEDGAPQTSS
jgi:hypothetical protein